MFYRSVSFLLAACLFADCTRSLQQPWLNYQTEASGRINENIPSLGLAFDNTSLAFSPWQSGFAVHNILDSSTRYYAVTGENTYSLEIRFAADSAALYGGKSLVISPSRFTIYQYGTSPIAGGGPSNIILTVSYINYALQGSYSGWFYNQLTGEKSSVSGTIENLALTIAD